jgi:hypothetical protein
MIMSRIKHREGSGSFVRFVVLSLASLLILSAIGANLIVDLIPQSVSAQTLEPVIYKISVDGQQHDDYGLGYPVTYVFEIPAAYSDGLKAFIRYSTEDSWSQLATKTSSEFFNGIDCVRFDYALDRAYVSVAFSGDSDDIYIWLTDQNDDIIQSFYLGIAEHYDDRKAAVVVTADDWDGYEERHTSFMAACDALQSKNIWITTGIVPDGMYDYSPPTPIPIEWAYVQNQVDEGYVEVASHGSTHDMPPYADYDYEIGGCKANIVGNLNLPSIYTKDDS